MKYFKIDFSNGKYVITYENDMITALETATFLNNSNPLRCYEISEEEYKGITSNN